MSSGSWFQGCFSIFKEKIEEAIIPVFLFIFPSQSWIETGLKTVRFSLHPAHLPACRMEGEEWVKKNDKVTLFFMKYSFKITWTKCLEQGCTDRQPSLGQWGQLCKGGRRKWWVPSLPLFPLLSVPFPCEPRAGKAASPQHVELPGEGASSSWSWT